MKISDTGFSAPRLPETGVWSRSETASPFNTLLASQLGDQNQETPPVLLGTITRETPTISQLLYKSPLTHLFQFEEKKRIKITI